MNPRHLRSILTQTCLTTGRTAFPQPSSTLNLHLLPKHISESYSKTRCADCPTEKGFAVG